MPSRIAYDFRGITEDRLKVVHTIASLSPSFGGPSRTVPQLCQALTNHSLDVSLIALHELNRKAPATKWPFCLTLISTRGSRYLPIGWLRRFKHTIDDRIESARRAAQPLILHDHGLWLPTNHFASQMARRLRVPFVVSPRGMLTGWALRAGRLRKWLAWRLYQRRDLQQAQILHATSMAEAESFRKLGLLQPIAVVPNGVELPAQWKGRNALSSLNHTSSLRTLLFLSRLHPKKGLPDLVRAWAAVRPQSWRVVVAGPGEAGHQAEIENLARELGVQADFEFIGPVADEQKWRLYRNADVFVLPSYSENFGVVIAEALACGVPVIATKATPWQILVEQHCGWWIDVGAEALTDTLRQATALDDLDRQEMGKRGRRVVETFYTWTAAAQRMVSVYEWIGGLAERPACLI